MNTTTTRGSAWTNQAPELHDESLWTPQQQQVLPATGGRDYAARKAATRLADEELARQGRAWDYHVWSGNCSTLDSRDWRDCYVASK